MAFIYLRTHMEPFMKRKEEWNRNRTEKERIEEEKLGAAPLIAHCVVPL
jgi:hypothetical protein